MENEEGEREWRTLRKENKKRKEREKNKKK